ncbi:MAG: signal peptidase II [Oligoflexia bacterium]|nr:signal peptidase II [Oligoflexia bacterium]
MIKRKYLILIALVGFLVSLDQLIKFFAYTKKTIDDDVYIISSFLQITYTRNFGAIFGYFSNINGTIGDIIFLGIPLCVLIILFALFSKAQESNKFYIYGLGSIIGGAFGNLIDRMRFGFVIDYIDFHYSGFHFPAFNFADTAITFGVLFLLISLFLERTENT